MPSIAPLSGSGGIDEVWGDYSGGQIVFSIAHPNGYVSHNQFRVWPFDSTGTFTAGGPGGTTTLQQEADNLFFVLKAMYHSTTTITAQFALQTLSDHTGEVPFGYSFGGTSTGAGTAAGADGPVPDVVVLHSRGADGSRWQLTLAGCSVDVNSGGASKTSFPSLSGATQALAQYLTGQTNGGVHGVKTNVVTHNGVAILFSPGNAMTEINKRLRRRFGLV